VSARADRPSLAARLWASRWPEVAWAVFAVGNLIWMVLMPSWSMLPFHFTWVSLLLLYALGYRTCTRTLAWWLVVPVMAGAVLLFVDAQIQATQPYDEYIEVPVMVVMLFAITRHTNRSNAAMAALDQVSRHNMELLERQRAFVQNASHELRTPITVALAHAELLPESAGQATAASDAAIVVDELGRLRGLVDQLLLLATADQPDLLHLEPVRLVSLVDDALRRWEPTPRQWVAGRRDDVTVLADPERMMLALDSVIDNAVKFTGDGDRIELSAQRRERDAAIVIADSGPGIPEGELESVFDRFAGADPQRGSTRSFGLGLSIVRAIAQAQGGRVTAARGPAGGTVVTLSLPLRRQAVSGAAGPAPATGSAPR
jgi:two-component system, OmpR family, sensor kinase